MWFTKFGYQGINFQITNTFYIQVDGFAMDPPLGPVLAGIFLSNHEEHWLNKCPKEFEPSFYRRWVDDIFSLFQSPKSAHSFREYMSSKRQNITFTIEKENIGPFSFLDVKFCRKNSKFITSVYRKPIFNVVFINYESLIPTYKERGMYKENEM